MPTFVDTGDFSLAANTSYYFEFIVNHTEYNASQDINKSLMIVSGGVHFSVVPAPAAAWLFASGLLALAGLRNRRAGR